MFELIGLAIGGFLGYLVADFLAALDPLRNTVRMALNGARDKVLKLAGSYGNNPLIPIGALLIGIVLVFWLLGFSSAVVLGMFLGIVYKEEIGRLPFIAGLADTIKRKISGPK